MSPATPTGAQLWQIRKAMPVMGRLLHTVSAVRVRVLRTGRLVRGARLPGETRLDFTLGLRPWHPATWPLILALPFISAFTADTLPDHWRALFHDNELDIYYTDPKE